MSVEFFPHTDAEAARAHFDEFGHVGLAGLYDPSLGEQAIHDSVDLSRRAQGRGGGEQTNTLREPDERRQQALYAVVEGIRNGASLLDRDLSASERGEKPFFLLIEMQKGAKGPKHTDRILADIVAVTTLTGRSRLWYEDGSEYDLTAGMTVFHDFDRSLVHQGSTGPQDKRMGLVVGKTAARSFMRRAA